MYMYFRKNDLFLYGVIIVTGFLFIFSLSGERNMYKPGTVSVVKGGDSTVFSLSADATHDIGTHKLVISGGAARVTEARCPLKICEHQGWITSGVIACVPNRVMIVVTPLNDDVDVILR